MIVDLERNDLSRVCEPGAVRWPELMAERELAGVTHLVSTVEGTLREDVALAELLDATFPGGSVTGAPKIAALDQIARSSPSAAAPRWARSARIRPNGDLELALTIRTFAIADGQDAPLGRRRNRLGLRPAGGDRGVVGQGAAAPRRARRPLGVNACAARRRGGRGLVDPDEPVVHADDEAVLRGRAAFETCASTAASLSARRAPRAARASASGSASRRQRARARRARHPGGRGGQRRRRGPALLLDAGTGEARRASSRS